MKRKSFTEDQITGVQKEHGTGSIAAELFRSHRICDATGASKNSVGPSRLIGFVRS